MSEREKWMPDAERLCMAFDLSDQAWEEISDGERGPDGSWLDPLRAVVREAVENALAEQERMYKRAVIEAKIMVLLDSAVALENARAELAALDKEVKP